MGTTNCPRCRQIIDPDTALIERLLEHDIAAPHERLTKPELRDWIDDHIKMLNAVRSLLLKTYAYQIANMAIHSPDKDATDDNCTSNQ